MIHYLNLSKLFIKSLRINKANQNGGKWFFRLLMAFCILFIFIPFLLIFIAFVYSQMVKLNEVNYASYGFEALLGIISIFIFVFSFNVLLNELYFSDDLESMLPLPIKPELLLSSKFTSCFVVENIILFIFLFFACCSYLAALHLPISNLVISFVGIILLPLLPMLYGVIILLISMYLLRKIANKKMLKRIGFILLGLLILGVFILLYKLSSFDFEAYVENFAKGDHQFLDVMKMIFPTVSLFIRGLEQKSILDIVFYYGINIIAIVVTLILARLFYVDGVISVLSHDTDIKKTSIREKDSRIVRTAFQSLNLKERKVLFRSPTFFINCILINFIWPIFLFLIFKLGFPDYTFSYMRELVSQRDPSIYITCFLCSIGVSIMVTAFNSIASSSYSREGKNYFFTKYIPVFYGKQWRTKFHISFILSFWCINIYMILFYGLIHLPFLTILYFVLISLLCVCLVSFIGILIDSRFPKIVWDDEADALRENYNTFVAMGFSLLFFGVLCGGGYLLYHKYSISFFAISLLSFCILLLCDSILYVIADRKIPKYIIEQENV